MNPEESDVTTQEAEMIDKIFDLGETTVRGEDAQEGHHATAAGRAAGPVSL